MSRFSLIICTYNPEPAIFQRLLNAVMKFETASPEHEVIIVDNNSSPALSENKSVQSFLTQKQNSGLTVETKEGLTSARIAGIEQAKYEWIIFFDDDNEPSIDYLKTAAFAIEQHPQVGAWGPGTIKVVYTENKDKWLETKKDLFQERNEIKTIFAKEQSWQPCYPFGTGMIIRKEIADNYALKVRTGRYTLTDRKRKSLASGGDVQLVFTAIETGFASGSIAGLYLNHLIDSSKANFSYLQKQQYGTASAYIKAYNQVFQNNKIEAGKVTNFIILKKIYSLYRIHRSKLKKKDFQLLMASKMGAMNAALFAKDKSKPILLKWYEKMINA